MSTSAIAIKVLNTNTNAQGLASEDIILGPFYNTNIAITLKLHDVYLPIVNDVDINKAQRNSPYKSPTSAPAGALITTSGTREGCPHSLLVSTSE